MSTTRVGYIVGGCVCFCLLLAYSRTMNPEEYVPTSIPTAAPSKFEVEYPTPKVMYEEIPLSPKGHIVVTGGAGFIGSQLGYYLHTLGYEVTLIDNMAYGYDDNLVVDGKRFGRFILGDVLDLNILPYLKGVDTIFHFAALSALPVCQSHPRDALTNNVGGVANILEGARKHGVRRFIFASTSAVYENSKAETFSETTPIDPHLLYSLTKQQGEMLVKSMSYVYGLDVVILRFFNVYGPHQDFRRKSPPFTSYLIRELVNNRVPVLHSDGKQRRDYVYITDLLDLALRAMTTPDISGETFNVASGETYSVNEMFDIVAKALGSSIRPVYHSAKAFWDAYPELFEGAKPIKQAILEKEVNKFTVGSYDNALSKLGWRPKVKMEEGLKRMAQFVQTYQKEKVKGEFAETAWKV